MAGHHFTQEQMQYIEATMDIKAAELRGSISETTTNAQIAFTLSQTKLDVLFVEAQSSSARVDAQVKLINEMKQAIEEKVTAHQQAIIASGQTADGAHARLSSLLEELNQFHATTAASIEEVKSSGGVLRKETTEEFSKFRASIEMWYEGIKSHLDRGGGGDGGKGKGGGDSKGGSRVDKKDIAVWKLPDDLD